MYDETVFIKMVKLEVEPVKEYYKLVRGKMGLGENGSFCGAY
jgi:hypothetical protein